MNLLKYIAFIITFLLFVTSCEEDEEIENLNNAYIESVSIINVPPYYWDNGSSPDLQLFLGPKDSSDWVYSTNRSYDVESVPEELLFDSPIKMTNEDWIFQLIDYDYLSSSDQIYRIIFNPFEDAVDGVIPIYNNGLLLLEFNYSLK